MCIYLFFVFSSFFSSVCRPFLIYILFSLSLVLLQSERTGLFVVLLFCFCCLGNEQRKNDQKKKQNPCFIVFLFVLLSLQVLATERPILREKTKRGKQDSKKEKKRGKQTIINWEIGRKSEKKH